MAYVGVTGYVCMDVDGAPPDARLLSRYKENHASIPAGSGRVGMWYPEDAAAQPGLRGSRENKHVFSGVVA